MDASTEAVAGRRLRGLDLLLEVAVLACALAGALSRQPLPDRTAIPTLLLAALILALSFGRSGTLRLRSGQAPARSYLPLAEGAALTWLLSLSRGANGVWLHLNVQPLPGKIETLTISWAGALTVLLALIFLLHQSSGGSRRFWTRAEGSGEEPSAAWSVWVGVLLAAFSIGLFFLFNWAMSLSGGFVWTAEYLSFGAGALKLALFAVSLSVLPIRSQQRMAGWVILAFVVRAVGSVL